MSEEEKETAERLDSFNNNYCGLEGDPLALLSSYQIYLFGHQNFDHPSNIIIMGPDDFINSRIGKVLEDLTSDFISTSFADISSLLESRQVRLAIVYIHQKLRPSAPFGRLCQILRTSKFPIAIIVNSALIEGCFLPYTIPFYIPPSLLPLKSYRHSAVEPELEKIRELIKRFWQDFKGPILENYKRFPTPDWLINDEDSWLPILAPAQSVNTPLGKGTFAEKILQLAERIIKSRKRDESSLSLEAKVLQATQAFIKAAKPMKENPRFYNGLDLLEFIRKMIDRPNLPLEKISEILNRNDVVVDTWRPHLEVVDKERSTKKKQVMKIIQITCYEFNAQKLSEAQNKHFGGNNGNQHGGSSGKVSA